MKNCPYCGKECPDDAMVCPIDGTSLAAEPRKKISGVWRGVYGYGPLESQPGFGPAVFTLRLKQGWTEHFTGTITEDEPAGNPENENIEGYFQYPAIEFIKKMPVGGFIKEDGSRVTIREAIIEKGFPCKHEVPGPSILYQGTFLDNNRVQGVWTIDTFRMTLPDRSVFSLPRVSGFWCTEFVGDDLKANPTNHPASALFDKSLLLPEELADVEGEPMCSLGKFSVPDADRLIARLAEAGIFCQFSRDDAPMREMSTATAILGGYSGTAPLMEICVKLGDEARAREMAVES